MKIVDSFANFSQHTPAARVIGRRSAGLILSLVLIFGDASPADDNHLVVFGDNQHPTRIATGSAGGFAVTDFEGKSVFIYDSALSIVGEIKQVDRPIAVAVDQQGRFLVGCANGNLEVYDAGGAKVEVASEGVLSQPNDMAVDFNGRVYMADSRNDRVFVFDALWNWDRIIGSSGSGNGQFSFPSCVAIAYHLGPTNEPVGELFVGDQGNHRVQVFDLNGTYLRSFGSNISDFGTNWLNRFNTLQTLVVDDLLRPHVVDLYLSRVQVFDAQTSTNVLSYGTFGTGPGQMRMPLDIAMADDGRIIAADADNGRLAVIYSNAMTRVLLSTNIIDEMAPTGTVVGTLTADPAPAGPNVFLLVPMPGGADNSFFVIDGDLLRTAAPLDHETHGTCHIKIKAANSNSLNLIYGETMTITVNDVNDAPTGISLDRPGVNESLPTNSLAGVFITDDADTNDTFTYNFATGEGDTDNALFAISGDQLLTRAVFDYETTNAYSIRVSVRDAAGAAWTGALAVAVLNVNESTDPDTDGDGMPDWWELQCAGIITGLVPLDDSDMDGFDNLGEWILGTDPFDPSLFPSVWNLSGIAVDAPPYIWTTGGHAAWFEQTTNTHDGVDAAQSGHIADNQFTWMETTIVGPGRLTFWWKVSSEGGFDYLRFYVDGSEATPEISGNVDWQSCDVRIGTGSHTLQWMYSKNSSVSAGSDCGWVDQVTFWWTSGLPWLNLLLGP